MVGVAELRRATQTAMRDGSGVGPVNLKAVGILSD
jgi:hypothetical protein